MKKISVLMLGPARSVKGGMTTVVDNYFEYGLDKKVNLKYIETINDSNKFAKYIKEKMGMLEFKKEIDKYDIVHIHMASRRSTFRKGKYVELAKKKGKKVIIHIHGGEYKIFYNECNAKKQERIKNILNLADIVIVLSEEWKEYFSTLIDANKIVVMYNSIKIPADFDKDISTKKILFLGKICKGKGIYDLVNAIGKLSHKYPDIKVYVGGFGEIKKLEKIIAKNQIQNNFEFVGWASGQVKDRLLKDCTYYVLPSYNEGMPMSVLEGMAYKNITISTIVGGIPKVIQNEKNGILIHPGNINELCDTFNKLFNNKELRYKISINARKTIEKKFDVNKSIDYLLELYKI